MAQERPFGAVPPDSTTYRTFRHQLDPGTLAGLWEAMAGVRAQVWRRSSVTNTNGPVVLDDATVVERHAVGRLGRWPCRHGPVGNSGPTVSRAATVGLCRGGPWLLTPGGRVVEERDAGGLPLLVITTVGRKTGQKRSTPLGYVRHAQAFAVIASNAGSNRVPAWWLNLQTDPHAEILVNRTSHNVIARPATPTEDDILWAQFARLNPGYDEYRQLTERRIPVIILEPVGVVTPSVPHDTIEAADRP
jgi:F420H(2)-dependent quinone reductase